MKNTTKILIRKQTGITIFTIGLFLVIASFLLRTRLTYNDYMKEMKNSSFFAMPKEISEAKKREVGLVNVQVNKIIEQPKIVATSLSDKLMEVKNIDEIVKYGPTNKLTFNGTMTAYGPDCVGCGGRVGCPPRPDVRNGNILFNDKEYGNLKIVASDKRIPCGSIVKVKGARNQEDFLVIVLDRGGAIKETLFDLLYSTEKEASSFGRQQIVYELHRWGW